MIGVAGADAVVLSTMLAGLGGTGGGRSGNVDDWAGILLPWVRLDLRERAEIMLDVLRVCLIWD